MAAPSLTPTRLRLALIVVMAVLIGLSVGMVIYGDGLIKKYAVETQQTAVQARESSSELDRLKATQITLKAKENTIKKTARLASESKEYIYQDDIINGIVQYATDAGIKVTNISFGDVKTASPSGTAAPSTAQSATATPIPASIKSRTATITIENPVDYQSMLNFIHSIEGGVFRMRITNVGLSQSPGSSKVNSDILTVEVYVR